jgi:hypothetical protein
MVGIPTDHFGYFQERKLAVVLLVTLPPSAAAGEIVGEFIAA